MSSRPGWKVCVSFPEAFLASPVLKELIDLVIQLTVVFTKSTCPSFATDRMTDLFPLHPLFPSYSQFFLSSVSSLVPVSQFPPLLSPPLVASPFTPSPPCVASQPPPSPSVPSQLYPQTQILWVCKCRLLSSFDSFLSSQEPLSMSVLKRKSLSLSQQNLCLCIKF